VSDNRKEGGGEEKVVKLKRKGEIKKTTAVLPANLSHRAPVGREGGKRGGRNV